MKKCTTIFVALCCLTMIRNSTDAKERDIQRNIRECRSIVEQMLSSGLANDWEMLQPAAFRIQHDNNRRDVLSLEAKALPYAYLIGCTPALCSHPQRFITPALQRLFRRMPYEHIADVRCPARTASRADMNAFRMRTTLVFSELSRYLMLHKQTEQTRDFFLQFHTLFKERWMATQQELARGAETLLWDADAFEQFTDYQYTLLRITVYFYGVVWDGNGATYDTATHLLERELRASPIEFSVTLDAPSGRDRKDVEQELRSRAKEAAQYMLGIAKAIFVHGPVKKL